MTLTACLKAIEMSKVLLPWKDYPTGYTDFLKPDRYTGGEIVRHEALRNLHDRLVAEVWQKVWSREHNIQFGIIAERYFLWEGRIVFDVPDKLPPFVMTFHSFDEAKFKLEEVLEYHGYKIAPWAALSMK